MAHKIFSSVSILPAAALLAAAGCTPALAQTNGVPAGDPDVERGCLTVVLTSNNPQLPLRLIQPYLLQRADFQASKMALIEEPESADATVTLTQSGEHDTHIEVFSRMSGRHVSALSVWTDYPGMIALDVMEKLKVVCALPVAPPSQQLTAAIPGTSDPSTTPDQSKSMVARGSHSRGFKHFVGRVGFYTEEVLVDAAIVPGYAAMGIAMSAACSGL